MTRSTAVMLDFPVKLALPILDADEARQIVFLKRSMRPGFAGIENELLFDPKTTLLFGDAKESLAKLLAAVKAL